MEVTMKQNVISDMKQQLNDILFAVSWREVANNYFSKSVSWFYHKMDGIDGNGGKGGFNEEEASQLRGALYDLSDRIRRAADGIQAPASIAAAI
ncbi:MAG: DUF5053 domain-containing protein [Bacteroidaceae bacterium]|nr:DUF5053 domain-containing protein [Bacteroidaceae bacterium]